MTRNRFVWIAVIVASLAALGSSIAWGMAQSGARGGAGGDGVGMMSSGGGRAGNPVTDLAQARTRAGDFARGLDLKVGEVMQFSNGFYAELTQKNGRLATEVLIDPRTGATSIERGPAMVWNTRYGMMGGRGSTPAMGSSRGMGRGATRGGTGMMGGSTMMGGGSSAGPSRPPGSSAATVNASQAQRLAQQWLDANRSGLKAAEAESFPGYYTLHVERGGKIEGMLSVNASTGAVWYHSWHGRFVAMDG